MIPQEPTGNRLIAKNATMLYLRMFVTLAISFYTSRVVLKALGVSDYGIYNVVGGVIVMISTLTGALGGATSRFLTFALGKKNPENLKITFSTAFYIHLALALLFVVVAESVGVWFVNTQLVIPEGRMGAANWVFQAVIVSTALGMTQVPYSASITSHEKMATFAYLEIANAVIKLGVAFFVLVSSVDHLKLYSILLMSMSIGFQLYYRFYCIRHFEECHITRRFDKGIFKEMLSFSGWSMVGSLSLMFKNQGINILINRFFGTLINAAVGVAGQVQGILYAFSNNVSVAFRPQIIKSYAAGDYPRMNELVEMGAKFSSMVTILTTIPFIFSMQYLMSIWLEEVPVGAVEICQILLFTNFFNSFNPYLYMGINASGRIRNMNIAVSILYIGSLVLTYVILKLTHSYILSYSIGILSAPASTAIYVIILKKLVPEFRVGLFFLKAYIPMALVAVASLVLAWFLSHLGFNQLVSFLLVAVICTSFVCFSVYTWVLDAYSKKIFMNFVKSKLHIK